MRTNSIFLHYSDADGRAPGTAAHLLLWPPALIQAAEGFWGGWDGLSGIGGLGVLQTLPELLFPCKAWMPAQMKQQAQPASAFTQAEGILKACE